MAFCRGGFSGCGAGVRSAAPCLSRPAATYISTPFTVISIILVLQLHIWISAEIGKGPGLKAQHFGINFRGLKASAPSDLAIYNCSLSPTEAAASALTFSGVRAISPRSARSSSATETQANGRSPVP
jgi:hypothetical protein